jgi:hypothetical protein
MKMDDKWKRFAIMYILTSYNGDPVDVYNRLEDASYDDLPALFEELSILAWHRFEDCSETAIVEYITDLAASAQEVEIS